jgi:hypothetical protein
MKKSFTLGAASGMSVLSLAVVLLAQTVGAQSSGGTAEATRMADHPTPSQECVTAMADMHESHLANMDTMHEAHKTMMTAYSEGLRDAAEIADDEARAEAIKKIREDMRTAMEAARPNEENTALRDALKDACGDTMMLMGHGGPGMMGGGHMKMKMHNGKGMLAEKLGMTEDELKSALQEGKTIEDLAQEAGVELPPRPEMGKRMGGMRMKWHGEDAAE